MAADADIASSGKENKEDDGTKRNDKDRSSDRGAEKKRESRSRSEDKGRKRESRRSDDDRKRESRRSDDDRKRESRRTDDTEKDSLKRASTTHGDDGRSSRTRSDRESIRRSTSHGDDKERSSGRDREGKNHESRSSRSDNKRGSRSSRSDEKRESRRSSDRDHKDRDRRRDSSRDRDGRRRSSRSRQDDKDTDRRSSRSSRHETREEREERKKREKEERAKEEERKQEKLARREQEREERRKQDEENKKRKEELRAQRRKEKGIEGEADPSTLTVNRADLRQMNKERFNDVYSMGRIIYKGDEGTKVYKCYHRATGTERCVKITPKKSSVNHEFEMLKNMDHPNILTMYDLFAEQCDSGFEWYLVIDLCKGKSLYHYLQKRSCKPGKEILEEKAPEPDDDIFGLGALMMAAEDAVSAAAKAVTGEEDEEIVIEEGEHYGLDEAECKQVMLQVMSCVNYLHKNRLVHADIKPQNLIMATGIDLSTLKMLDFDNSVHLRKANDKISSKKGTPEYMAPEVHAGNKYDYKCDIWSCGVMAYQLLSNQLPFGDSKNLSEEEIAAKVEDGRFSLAGPAWGHVSEDAKDFVKSLLVLRDKQRPTAEKAIHHKWLTGEKKLDANSTAQVVKLNEDDTAKAAMSNFKNFKADSKLKKATCAFIASQLLTKEEKDKIDTIFRTMDITRDGKLSKAEVKAGFYKVSGQFLSDQEINEMFARVDCDGTGEIEYSEFVIASMSETDLLSKERLKKAFQLFDKDNSGSITISELREIFSFFQTAGSDIDDAYIDKVIAQIDADGDGDVSFDEFCEMMINGIPV